MSTGGTQEPDEPNLGPLLRPWHSHRLYLWFCFLSSAWQNAEEKRNTLVKRVSDGPFLQLSIHNPHRIHSEWSILPLLTISSTSRLIGQFLVQTWQETHLSTSDLSNRDLHLNLLRMALPMIIKGNSSISHLHDDFLATGARTYPSAKSPAHEQCAQKQ